jgi:antitoxin component YwqK of YwqJK toxin-antitoxin module
MNFFLKFITIALFLFSVSISAQKITWLDAGLKETKQPNAVYYKVISSNGEKVDIFYKSGGIFRNLGFSKGKKRGWFSEFHETGELKISGRYANDLQEGIWKTYYKNGKIKEKGKYKKGEKVGIWKSFYKNF